MRCGGFSDEGAGHVKNLNKEAEENACKQYRLTNLSRAS